MKKLLITILGLSLFCFSANAFERKIGFSASMANNIAMRAYMGRDVSDPSFKAFEKNNFATLQTDLERLKKEVLALQAALRSHGASLTSQPDSILSDQDFMTRFDKTCRVLKLVLDASEGMFTVDTDTTKISCAYNDLEPLEGLAPKELIEPFVLWLKDKEKDHGAK